MRVSYVSTFPPTRCGIGTYTKYLSKALLEAGKGIEVSVAAERGAARVWGQRFKVLPCFSRRENYAKDVIKALSRLSPDLIHVQHEFAIFNPDERFLELLKGLKGLAKVVLTLHTIHTNQTSDWKQMPISMEEYNREMCRNADVVIVHQNCMRKALIDQGVDGGMIRVIPHGTEILEKVKKSVAARRLGLPEGKIILSFGFFGWYKNKHFIVEALPRVLKEVPDAYIFYSGFPREGLEEDLITRGWCEEKAEELGVRDHVIFAPRFIPDEEIYLVFGSCDVAVFPYLQRYYSAAGGLHLALGAFKPVAVSRIPKFEEVWVEISDELVFDPSNPAELGEILVRLLTDEGFRSHVVERVKSYALRTSWSEVAKTHKELYEALGGGG